MFVYLYICLNLHNLSLSLCVCLWQPDYGILSKVTAVTLDPQGSPAKLVSLMDNDRSLKKTSCYVIPGKNAKSPEAFFIKHAGLGQVGVGLGDWPAYFDRFVPFLFN